MGRFKSTSTPRDRLLSKVDTHHLLACWLWTGSKDKWGYGHFYLNGRTIGAHRASWIIHNGEIPKGQQVCHRCDTPACVNPTHLWLGSQTENLVDAFKKGRSSEHLKKLRKMRCKLNVEQVDEIRRLHGLGLSPDQLAHSFGVVPGTVYAILSGKNWGKP